jgi:hypothetical protein
MMRLFTDQREFNYIKPYMSYDKASGEVTIIEGRDLVQKPKIVEDIEDYRQESIKLF